MSNLKIGIDVVTKATQHDSQRRYKEAVYLYTLSLDYFQEALREEVNVNNVSLIKSKIQEYENRSRVLIEALKRTKPDDSTNANSTQNLGTASQRGSLPLSSTPSPTAPINHSITPSPSAQTSPTSPMPPRPNKIAPKPTRPPMAHPLNRPPSNQTLSPNPSTLLAVPVIPSNAVPPSSPNLNPSVLQPNAGPQRAPSPQQPNPVIRPKAAPVRGSPTLPLPKKLSTSAPTNQNPTNDAVLRRGNTAHDLSMTSTSTSASAPSISSKEDEGHEFNKDRSIPDLFKQAEQIQESDPRKAAAIYRFAAEKLLIANTSSGIEAGKPGSRNFQVENSRKDGKKMYNIDFEKDEVCLHERLGGGGSGAVVTRCTVSGFSFAAKILQTETVAEVIEAIKGEIHIMESLDHPNIVKYLGHDLTRKGEIRLYLEYYMHTLRDLIRERRETRRFFSVKEVAVTMFQICKGLNYLHTLPTPVMHRDLKSENVFVRLDPQGNVQSLHIGDFDTSKILTAAKVTYTRNTGTEGFMAPETLKGNKGYSAQADVFSFGMVMFEMFTLEKPYSSITDANKKWEVMEKGKRPELSAEGQEMYKPLIPLWEKCTKKNPAKRPIAKKILQKLSEFL